MSGVHPAEAARAAEPLAQVLRSVGVEIGYAGAETYRRVVAERILADPGPLLAALAEAGVLEVEGSVRRGCGCRVREGNITAACCYLVGEGGPDVPERRYVTAWQEAQP